MYVWFPCLALLSTARENFLAFQGEPNVFFLEHAGELHINILRREGGEPNVPSLLH